MPPATAGSGSPDLLLPVPAQLSFHASFFVAARRVAILALETPVRPEGDDAFGFHALPAAQDLLHRAREVVVAQRAEDAVEVGERVLVPFQKRLLGRVGIGPVEGVSRSHAPHREELQLAALAAQLRYRFEPIDLRFLAPVVALRHEYFPAVQS